MARVNRRNAILDRLSRRKVTRLDYLVAVLAIVGGVALLPAVPLGAVGVIAWLDISAVYGGWAQFLVLACLAGSLHVMLGFFAIRQGAEAMAGRLESGLGLLAEGAIAVPSAFYLLGGWLGLAGGLILVSAGLLAYLS